MTQSAKLDTACAKLDALDKRMEALAERRGPNVARRDGGWSETDHPRGQPEKTDKELFPMQRKPR